MLAAILLRTTSTSSLSGARVRAPACWWWRSLVAISGNRCPTESGTKHVTYCRATKTAVDDVNTSVSMAMKRFDRLVTWSRPAYWMRLIGRDVIQVVDVRNTSETWQLCDSTLIVITTTTTTTTTNNLDDDIYSNRLICLQFFVHQLITRCRQIRH